MKTLEQIRKRQGRCYELAVVFAAILAIQAPAARADTCSNVVIDSNYYFSAQGDEIEAQGTLRIFGDDDQKHQPDYNLTQIECERKGDLKCKLRRTMVGGVDGSPGDDKTICAIVADETDFKMKEVSPGVLVGMARGLTAMSSTCFDAVLTINRNTKRATVSFEQKRFTGHCSGSVPRPQTLMKCTRLAAIRAAEQSTPPLPPDTIFSLRRCDFVIEEVKIAK